MDAKHTGNIISHAYYSTGRPLGRVKRWLCNKFDIDYRTYKLRMTIEIIPYPEDLSYFGVYELSPISDILYAQFILKEKFAGRLIFESLGDFPRVKLKNSKVTIKCIGVPYSEISIREGDYAELVEEAIKEAENLNLEPEE